MNDSQKTRLARHVICALDVDQMVDALELVDQLSGYLTKFKVGSRLFTRCGPALMEALAARDVEIFLDLKFHDIPNTVAGAVESAMAFDAVSMLTVHAVGGAEMIRRAALAAESRGGKPVKIVAVTALTSLSAAEIAPLGVHMSLEEWACTLGDLALAAGADGLVCSAHEVGRLRARYGDAVTLVTPGIRPVLGTPTHTAHADDDQTRVMRPKDALDAGSDFLVIGRPIYQADDPLEAVRAIGQSL